MTTAAQAEAERIMDTCPCSPDEWVGRVQVGDPSTVGGSAWVCGLRSHREAAETYYRAIFPDLPMAFIPKEEST